MKTAFILSALLAFAQSAPAQESLVTVGRVSNGNNSAAVHIMEYKGITLAGLSVRNLVYTAHLSMDVAKLKELRAVIDETIARMVIEAK